MAPPPKGMPALLLLAVTTASAAASDGESPIENVVVLALESRSLDHMMWAGCAACSCSPSRPSSSPPTPAPSPASSPPLLVVTYVPSPDGSPTSTREMNGLERSTASSPTSTAPPTKNGLPCPALPSPDTLPEAPFVRTRPAKEHGLLSGFHRELIGLASFLNGDYWAIC